MQIGIDSFAAAYERLTACGAESNRSKLPIRLVWMCLESGNTIVESTSVPPRRLFWEQRPHERSPCVSLGPLA